MQLELALAAPAASRQQRERLLGAPTSELPLQDLILSAASTVADPRAESEGSGSGTYGSCPLATPRREPGAPSELRSAGQLPAICVRSGVRRVLKGAHLDAATQCLRRLRRPPDCGILVWGLDHPEAADVLRRLNERSVDHHGLAAGGVDGLGRRRRVQAPGEANAPDLCRSLWNSSTAASAASSSAGSIDAMVGSSAESWGTVKMNCITCRSFWRVVRATISGP